MTPIKDYLSQTKHHHFLIILLATAFLLRIAIALIFPQIYYADSIFQILEQGFRHTYGFGIIPLEFALGIRSWLPALTISYILQLTNFIAHQNPIYYTKIVSLAIVLFSLSIPISLYFISFFYTKNKKLSLLVALISVFWYELVYFAPQALFEIFASQLILVSLALALKKKKSAATGILFAFFLIISYSLRPHYLLTLPILFIIYLKKNTPSRIIIPPLLGAILGIIIIGLVDRLFWGEFLHSTIHYLLINFNRGAQLINDPKNPVDQPFLYYPLALIITSAGIFLISIKNFQKHLPIWLLVFAVLIPHTIINHKEYRFIFLVIPLLLFLSTINAHYVFTKRSTSSNQALAKTVILFFCISILGFLYLLPFQQQIYQKPLLKTQSDLLAYQWLHQQPDICGLYDATQAWMTTGGYYYLGANIPLYTLYYPPPNISHFNYVISTHSNIQHPGFNKIKHIDQLYIYSSTRPCQKDPHYTNIRLVPNSIK